MVMRYVSRFIGHLFVMAVFMFFSALPGTAISSGPMTVDIIYSAKTWGKLRPCSS